MLETAYVRVRGQTTKYEVADVFRQYGEAYRQQYAVTPEQARVMGALLACRTAALGGQIYVCDAYATDCPSTFSVGKECDK